MQSLVQVLKQGQSKAPQAPVQAVQTKKMAMRKALPYMRVQNTVYNGDAEMEGEGVISGGSSCISEAFPVQVELQREKQAVDLVGISVSLWLLQDEGRMESPRAGREKQGLNYMGRSMTYLTEWKQNRVAEEKGGKEGGWRR